MTLVPSIRFRLLRGWRPFCALAPVIAIASLLLLCQACLNDKKEKKPAAPPPVTVVKAKEMAIPLVFDTYGLVEPYAQISIKSKLTGKIMKLGFEPGQKIEKDKLLVQFDDREYLADLKMYQAQLKKNQILSEDTQRILEMKERLLLSNAVTATETATQRAAAESAKAALESDKAAIENTLLNIEYCKILAPFDGIAGDILIHSGSIVKANDDTIGKFAQIKPIYVSFALPERMLPSVREILSAGKKVEVTSKIPGDKIAEPVKGEIKFIDNEVDAASGTIKMKAIYLNADERLWPGQYVDVVVELSKDETFIAVPTDSIMSGQSGQQVFVLKDDSTVELRHVEPERSYDGFTAVKGLKADETVILTGQFRLAPGSKVYVKDTSAEADKAKTEK